MTGTVYLVGAGPGDPELITRRGASLLSRADVVIHDRLIPHELLSLAPPTAEVIDVGKTPGQPRRQHDINELLVSHGKAGQEVVRLKGGDPFVFGRGGEEVEALQAVPAYAGIPVTHRGLSSSFTVVTGHTGDPSAPGGVDWAALARAGGTLVVLMGMGTRVAISAELMAGGRPGTTPVAVVHWGTTDRQRVERTTLDLLPGVDLPAPSIIVIGPVAALGG